ncbi:hypothetical protein [Herbaspirillum sp. ST 5-3]|uniref:hypothetical protein n=1 Tax=Oxalobacteraceae TaxID=75682 RepID=UPI0010A4ADDE|nr:hypothetical protein [Herbaspirillum sp. ST 5-3]
MSTIRRTILILALCASPWTGATAHARDHRHQGPGERQEVPGIRPAVKWETDDIVRQRMEIIRQAVATVQVDIQQDRLDSHGYQQLAELINTNVGQIIKDCKLTQAADAALNTVVLTDLTHSSELMRTSLRRPAQRAGALGVLQSLRLYGEYFEHPGWKMAQAQ